MTTNPTEFQSFKKIPRLSREIVITEKIDGTNAQILIAQSIGLSEREVEQSVFHEPPMSKQFPRTIFAGSRNRWIQPGDDNFGFAAWVRDNALELLKLGLGRHFGEWFGSGIQRGYGLKEKRFALFNVERWTSKGTGEPGVYDLKTDFGNPGPNCCYVVPTLYVGAFDTLGIRGTLASLEVDGSVIVPGFKKPEGIVIYHKASGCLFKKTIENDEAGKSE